MAKLGIARSVSRIQAPLRHAEPNRAKRDPVQVPVHIPTANRCAQISPKLGESLNQGNKFTCNGAGSEPLHKSAFFGYGLDRQRDLCVAGTLVKEPTIQTRLANQNRGQQIEEAH